MPQRLPIAPPLRGGLSQQEETSLDPKMKELLMSDMGLSSEEADDVLGDPELRMRAYMKFGRINAGAEPKAQMEMKESPYSMDKLKSAAKSVADPLVEYGSAAAGGAMSGARFGPTGAVAGGALGLAAQLAGNKLAGKEPEALSAQNILNVLPSSAVGKVLKTLKLGPGKAEFLGNIADNLIAPRLDAKTFGTQEPTKIDDMVTAGAAAVPGVIGGTINKAKSVANSRRLVRDFLNAKNKGSNLPDEYPKNILAMKDLEANRALEGEKLLKADSQKITPRLSGPLEAQKLADTPEIRRGEELRLRGLEWDKLDDSQKALINGIHQKDPKLFYRRTAEELFNSDTYPEATEKSKYFAEQLKTLMALEGPNAKKTVIPKMRKAFIETALSPKYGGDGKGYTNPDSLKKIIQSSGKETTEAMFGPGSYKELTELLDGASRLGALGKMHVRVGNGFLSIIPPKKMWDDGSLNLGTKTIAGLEGLNIAKRLSPTLAKAAGVAGVTASGYKITWDKFAEMLNGTDTKGKYKRLLVESLDPASKQLSRRFTDTWYNPEE